MKRIVSYILAAATLLGFLPIEANADGSNILVVYFSCTNTTEGVAQSIQELIGADIYEIIPEDPYTDEDLNYNDSDCRANLEQNDDSARPAIAGTLPDMSGYDAVFVGYPIWWGKLPKIMYTFFDSCDLSGKMIIPFCTSGGSGIATSVNEIKTLEPNADVQSGRRFGSGTSQSTVKSWIDTLSLPTPQPSPTPTATPTPTQTSAPVSTATPTPTQTSTPIPAATPIVGIDGKTVTINNAPDNSTLIIAYYKNDLLADVDLKTFDGAITEDIADTSDADCVKVFLWDMGTLKPLCDAVVQ